MNLETQGRVTTIGAMVIEWDVPVTMNDGVVLRADIFRPAQGPAPAILSYGPYGKGLAFQDGYPSAWKILEDKYPDAVRGSSNQFQNWEVVDPEKWVPDGYVCVRFDSRGAGRSEGTVDHHSARETEDLYACVEWAASQPWCNGKVGLAGISYYATNQWRVAALQPPHLAAICVWEGYADRYRDASYHGGILCTFSRDWQEMQVKTVQNGLGSRGPRSRFNGMLVCGDVTQSDEELASRRSPSWQTISSHPFDGAYYRERSADFSRIKVPLLSAGNLGGHGLHLRGNIEGFTQSASERKWLELHGGEHWAEFYTDYGVGLQKQFFGYFLKGEDNGWDSQPTIQMHIRDVHGGFTLRHASQWPLPETVWTRFYVDLKTGTLDPGTLPEDASVSFEAMGSGLDFFTRPLERAITLAGPIAARLFVTSTTDDVDIFAVLRVFDPNGREVPFAGALDPNMPLAQGWLRASHRAIDAARSLPYRPWHTHEAGKPLKSGEPAELNIEIWPTAVTIPAGYRLCFTVRGKDYEYPGAETRLSNMKYPMRGCGPFVHDDPADRSAPTFDGVTTLHTDPQHAAWLLLPVLPANV